MGDYLHLVEINKGTKPVPCHLITVSYVKNCNIFTIIRQFSAHSHHLVPLF